MKALLKWALLNYGPVWAIPLFRYLISFVSVPVTSVIGAILTRLPGTSRNFGPPRHICEALAQYAAAESSYDAADVFYKQLYPSDTIRRSLPPSFGGIVHTNFHAKLRSVSPPCGFATIKAGRILTSSGIVIAPRDCLIKDITPYLLCGNNGANRIFRSSKLPSLRRVNETIAILTMTCSFNYYHFLFDTLPRLQLVEESGVPWDRIVVPREKRFQRESLHLLGLENDRIIAEPGLHLEAKTLLVPTLPGVVEDPPLWVSDFLRTRFSNCAADIRGRWSKKIYVSRAMANDRRIVNEADLIRALEGEGFQSFLLEDLSFPEQIGLFGRAEFVVGAHGSGLANLVFCTPGTRVVEIFGSNYVNPLYWLLSRNIRANYRCVVGRAMPKSWPESLWLAEDDGDTVVDVAKVIETLRSFSV
jgi:hypothetical protein